MIQINNFFIVCMKFWTYDSNSLCSYVIRDVRNESLCHCYIISFMNSVIVTLKSYISRSPCNILRLSMWCSHWKLSRKNNEKIWFNQLRNDFLCVFSWFYLLSCYFDWHWGRVQRISILLPGYHKTLNVLSWIYYRNVLVLSVIVWWHMVI